MTFQVVMTDTIFPDLKIENNVLEKINSEITLVEDPLQIIEKAKNADALVVVYEKITREIIEELNECKIIVRMGIGFNNIDLEAATDKGIYVVNVPDYCIDEVSDHTISLAFALLRKLHVYDKQAKRGIWDLEDGKPIYGFRGKTFGLIGFGNIPKSVARKLSPFGFNIVAYDPFVSNEEAKKYGVTLKTFDELLQISDVVSVHAPLVDSTHHLLNDEAFNKMKETAIVINTSRGPIIDSSALIRALENNKILGAGIDVLETEPPEEEKQLLKLDNAIITPHAAFYSEDSEGQLRISALEEVVRVLKGDKPKHLVNSELLNK